jgi:hypothetical protein
MNRFSIDEYHRDPNALLRFEAAARRERARAIGLMLGRIASFFRADKAKAHAARSYLARQG